MDDVERTCPACGSAIEDDDASVFFDGEMYHVACAPGNRVTTGVTTPSFMARRALPYLRGRRARSAMMFFCTSVAPAPMVV